MKAIAVFDGVKRKGTVTFSETVNNTVLITINLVGLKKNAEHGFHVHESGDLTSKCESMCAHFNPYNKTHGCPGQKERHVGDLVNCLVNLNAKFEKYLPNSDIFVVLIYLFIPLVLLIVRLVVLDILYILTFKIIF